jgi:tetratricopeptide (TPR) repeat protein
MKNASNKTIWRILLIILFFLLSCASTQKEKTESRDGDFYVKRGNAYDRKGKYDQAILDYTKALEINPRLAEAHNGLAWLLAAAKEPGIRNGEKAIEHALKACELSDWKNPNYLDTLAAAYARVGNFSNAIKWQEKALESPDFSKIKEPQHRLNLYRQRKAWPPD